MRFGDLFKLSTRMFKARPSRTLLTILGMSIGIGAILFLVSFGYGLQKTLLERITTSDSLLTLDVAGSKTEEEGLDSKTIEDIKGISGVEEVSPAFQLASQGQMGDISADLSVIGIKPSFLKLGGIKISRGEALDDQNKNEVVITSAVARVFGKDDPAEIIGQDINFSLFIPGPDSIKSGSNEQKKLEKIDLKNKYKITGVIEGEDNSVYLNADSLADLKIDNFSQLKVKCRSQQEMEPVRDSILEKGLLVSSLSDTVDQANKIFRVIQIVLMLFGFIALVVSAIGMFNTMTIALLERTEEIGIMKSIGASDGGISVMFIMESTIMGFLGGFGGVLIGLIGGEITNTMVNFVASRFGGETVRLFYSPLWFIAIIIIFAAFVGMLTGFVPARRASKIDPLEALRYK